MKYSVSNSGPDGVDDWYDFSRGRGCSKIGHYVFFSLTFDCGLD
jgi:hypothetical protein